MRKIISVIGDAVIEKESDKFRLAYETGKMLVDNGYRVQSGGMGGVMEAAFMGAHASEKYRKATPSRSFPRLIFTRRTNMRISSFPQDWI